MTEKKFNLWFSIIVLVIMVLVTVISTFYEMKSDPDMRLAMQLIAGVGAIMGVVNIVLSANGSIWTFIFGILDVICCSIVYYDSGVMGVFAEHAFYFLPMQFVGWWQWRKRGAGITSEVNEHGEKEIAKVRARRLTSKQWGLVVLAYILGTALCFGILYYIDMLEVNKGHLASIDNQKLLLDASIVMLNILGQFLMSTAYTEQWYLWNLVNICSILLWVNRLFSAQADSYTFVMLVKYILYLLNSINGLRIWLKLGKNSDATDMVSHKGCC